VLRSSARARGLARLAALVAGLALAVGLAQGAVFSRDQASSKPVPTGAIPSARLTIAAPPAPAHVVVDAVAADGAADRARIAAALQGITVGAHRYDGELEVGAMRDSWTAPLVRASTRHGADRAMRAWSMSKVFTAVSLLRAEHWRHALGEPLAAEVTAAMTNAIRRSENCAQRRVVLALQDASGGTPAAARAAISDVMRLAGATTVRVATQAEAPDPACAAYLATQRHLRRPGAIALLTGTSIWHLSDALRFTHALATGVYGDAVTSAVLDLMRKPKLRSREGVRADFSAPVGWGAGAAMGPGKVAYKAGWGGTQQGAFLAGQIAVIELPGNRWAAAAAMFHPHSEPPKDDPGLTRAPAAITAAMRALAKTLARH
jgi:hypothetical protein